MRLLLVLLVALALAPAAAAAARPDAHDRALVQQLAAKVTALQDISKKTDNGNALLDGCPGFKNNPSKAFAAVFALLPALLVDVVNRYKPQLQDLHDTFTGMHPDSALFRQWLGAQTQNIALILQFDNHGKKIDYCKAAQVMLSKNPTSEQIKDVLGIDPLLVAKLFSGTSTQGSKTVTKLNPQMRKFFLAGGLSLKQATALTSS